MKGSATQPWFTTTYEQMKLSSQIIQAGGQGVTHNALAFFGTLATHERTQHCQEASEHL